MGVFNESIVEEVALAWLGALGYSVPHGPDIGADGPGAERSDPSRRDLLLPKIISEELRVPDPVGLVECER